MTDKTGAMSYIGAGTVTVVGWFTVGEWAAIVGIVLAIATFFVNLYYKRRMTEINRVLAKEKLMLLREQREDIRRDCE